MWRPQCGDVHPGWTDQQLVLTTRVILVGFNKTVRQLFRITYHSSEIKLQFFVYLNKKGRPRYINRVAIGFWEIFYRFLKVNIFWALLVVVNLKLKRCFSIDWNYSKDTVLIFELCFTLLQPALTLWIKFFKVILKWLFKSLYVDII